MHLLSGDQKRIFGGITNYRVWFLAIILLAVILRLGAVLYLGDSIAGQQQERAYDQISYDALAKSLLAGHGYSFDTDWYPFTPANTPTAHWSFVYPVFIAGVYLLFGPHPIAVRIVQIIITGVLLPGLLYNLGSQLHSQKTGLVAAFLSSIYAYFVYYDATLMTESFFILFLIGSFVIAYQIISNHKDGAKHTLLKWLSLGIVMSVATLLRQTYLLWIPFFLAWIYWIGKRNIEWWGPIVSFGIVVLAVLPWTVRNFSLYESFLPLNSNAGYAIYSANHPYHGKQFDQDYAAPLPDDLSALNLNEAQWNTALMARGLGFILDDPGRYLLLSLDRIPIFFNAWFSSSSSLSSNLLRIFSYGLYLPFFLYGIVVSRKAWRRYSLIYLFAIIYSLIHILTWASIRYRLPIDAAMMPIAGLAVIEIMDKFHAKNNILSLFSDNFKFLINWSFDFDEFH